jgi:uncharacterized membrane protein YkvA (DUF1232 family)
MNGTSTSPRLAAAESGEDPNDTNYSTCATAYYWLSLHTKCMVLMLRQRGRSLKAARALVGNALKLFYSMKASDMPPWAKLITTAALDYFIAPIDLIPDILPGGYIDDFAVLTLALVAVSRYVTQQVKDSAERTLRELFQ